MGNYTQQQDDELSRTLEELDEEIGAAPVVAKTSITGLSALSTSLAFGGNNAAVIITGQ